MPTTIKGARPIKSKAIAEHYSDHSYRDVSLHEYAECWREWLQYSNHKTIHGLDEFGYADYTAGTSQTFDHFALKHADKNILVLRGDFQYHACINKHNDFSYVEYDSAEYLHNSIIGDNLHALIISVPFSDLGTVHPHYDRIMSVCEERQIPVCLDLAYWGISRNVYLDLGKYNCIAEVTCSLSKPFFTVENHRVGVRFTKDYADDGISMLNEVDMQNKHSMSLGVHYMKGFDPDWNWNTFAEQYSRECYRNGLDETDTVIFGLGDADRHSEYNRGIPHNYRVCVSEFLGDIL
jgi:hypothetical protein